MGRVLPRIVVNLKTYPEATGRRAVALAKAAEAIERRTGVGFALAVQAVDVRPCAETGATVYAQHVDRIESSQSTGATRWESLVQAGAAGTLINHSERRLPHRDLRWCVDHVRATKLVSLVCAKDSAEAAKLAALEPSMLAVEPPELIGGNVSVTSARPEVVRDTVRSVHQVAPRLPVLCGAGVKTPQDVATARKLGAFGILVASGVVLAQRPSAVMEKFARAAAGRR